MASRFHITTSRLWMRPLQMTDADALHALWTRPEVRLYLWDDVILPPQQTVAILQENERLFTEEALGLWGVFRQDEAHLIGFCGYWYFFEPPELQLLYGLAPEVWGHGFATEAARAMLAYGFDTLDLDAVIGCSDAPHHASQRVMERTGMHIDRRVTRDGLDSVYYRIDRPPKP